MAKAPHVIERNGRLQSATTEEVASLVVMHSQHDGIAYFADCAACQAARAGGRYPHWFPAPTGQA
jgi:hypothetical protein